MSIAITNKQRREIVRLEYRFILRQVRGNRLLIHGRSFGGALRDIQKNGCEGDPIPEARSRWFR